MMIPYEISTDRKTAALYLAWEFGYEWADKIMQEIQSDPFFPKQFVRLPPLKPFLVNRDGHYSRLMAEGWAQRIRMAVSFEEGRRGLPFTGGEVVVVKN